MALATWNGLFGYPVTSPRSLIFHAVVTLEAALAGFGLAALIGIGLAAAIVHSRLLDRGLLPWVIVSQSIPVLATAPMIVVVLGNAGFTGLLPKAVISASLAFFPSHHRHVQGAAGGGLGADGVAAHPIMPRGRRYFGSCGGRRRSLTCFRR